MKIKRKDLLKLIQEACGEVTEPVRLDLIRKAVTSKPFWKA